MRYIINSGERSIWDFYLVNIRSRKVQCVKTGTDIVFKDYQEWIENNNGNYSTRRTEGGKIDEFRIEFDNDIDYFVFLLRYPINI